MEKLALTQEWDKTFPKSENVNHSKVTFRNRYGIPLAADLYVPKDASGKPRYMASPDINTEDFQAAGKTRFPLIRWPVFFRTT